MLDNRFRQHYATHFIVEQNLVKVDAVILAFYALAA